MRRRSHGGPSRAAALIAAVALAGLALPQAAPCQPRLGRQADASVILPTGQRITPAGTQIVVNSMPLAAEVSPDGNYLLVLQAGYETPTVTAIDTSTKQVTSSVELADAWLGLTLDAAGERVFVGGGSRGSVWELSFRDGSLNLEREYRVEPHCGDDCPTLIGDVRLDSDDRMLYALDLFRDRAAVINTQSGLVLGEFKTGAAPYRARLTPDREHLVISHWGEAALGLFRLSDRQLVERIPVGEHPTDILVVEGTVVTPGSGTNGDEERTYSARLFTACSHADNVWTHGITDRNRFDLLDARSVAPFPDSPIGSLPSALGASDDGRTLYVANAGNNVILVTDIEEALPEPAGALPTAWYPTAVVGLADGQTAYLSGKGDGEHPGLVSVLPALTSDQLEFLSGAAVANIAPPQQAAPKAPEAVQHVGLVLTDARDRNWQRLLDESASVSGYVPPARGELSQIAWLTGGLETDFFARLGPAVSAGRLTPRELAAAGRAAVPVAGTLWSNAASASLSVDTYGIGRGSPTDVLVAKLRAESRLPRLAVVRLTGTPSEQDEELGRLTGAWRDHPAFGASAVFVVPVSGATGAAVWGGAVSATAAYDGLVPAPRIVRTIEWLVGLRPMTQFDAAAAPLTGAFERH